MTLAERLALRGRCGRPALFQMKQRANVRERLIGQPRGGRPWAGL